MCTRFLVLSAVIVLSAGGAQAADGPPDELVVSTSWLAAHLADPDLVLLHVGNKAEYEAAHLPGARFISTADIAASDDTGHGLHLEMLPPEVLRQRLESLGISNASRIVVYYGNDWISPATRVIFTLQYAGLGDRTALLDGGQQAWVREGRRVTSEVPAPRAGSLSPLKLQPLVVDADYVKAHLGQPGTVIVDARDAEFFAGTKAGGHPDRPHRRGHIAGAVSIPFGTLADDRVMLRRSADLRAAFAAAGVKPGDTVITYCHIGQQATAALFAARLLGHPVLLYDGSFEDWSHRAGYPVDDPSHVDKR
jgi:thiosulfate/3-mercaptopyruvate sulfurtransferase